MKKQMLTILLIVVGILIGAGGCGNLTPPSAAEIANFDYGVYPDNYKDIVKNYVLLTMIDPESAMFRFEGLPFQQYQTAFLGRPLRFGWIIKVSINGRNRFGGYAGWQRHWYMIKNGVIITEGFVMNGVYGGGDVLM